MDVGRGPEGTLGLGRILFVDDEPSNVELFRLQFDDRWDVVVASNAAEALGILSSTSIAVLVSDERMPGMRGVELLAVAAQRWPDVVRIIVSAYGDAGRLLSAINLGHAHEYVLKPWNSEDLGGCIDRALAVNARRRVLTETAARALHVEADAAAGYELGRIVGRESGLAGALGVAARAARAAVPVLVAGEHGTGKELVARFIHAESGRPGPFLRASCAHATTEHLLADLFGTESTDGVVRGRLEVAREGTIFLDNVCELPLQLQAKVARVLDEGTFERVNGTAPVPLTARVVASTHRVLEGLVASGGFLRELAYHFTVEVRVPPVRDRAADIAALAAHFAEKHVLPGEMLRPIDAAALMALEEYSWPGNVRELESIIARAVALATGPTLTLDDLAFRLDIPSVALSPREEARSAEATELRRLLLAHGGNLTRAARAVGVPRTTLLSRAKKLGLLP